LQTAADEACNALQPGATACNVVQPIASVGKTNPPTGIPNSRHPPRPQPPAAATTPPQSQSPATAELLTPRQLAAARLVAAGKTVPDVARELNLNRSTVWRWSREPAFGAELRRLHLRWSGAAAAATTTTAARPPRPRPRGPDPLASYLRGTT
jgi:hypothetical protein